MSTFKVTKEIVGSVYPAKNSDNLDLVHLESKDYDFITQKGLYKPGDVVIYFPVDSILPEWIVNGLGLSGKLKKDNRVTTIKLRGNLSQGVVCTEEDLKSFNKYLTSKDFKEDDLAPVLGVTKYEPPELPTKDAYLRPLPDLVSRYDIEGAQNYPDVLQSLMDQNVVISEKLEGSNWWAMIDSESLIHVGQRNYEIFLEKENHKHTWWEVFKSQNLESILIKIQKEFQGKPVTLRGEILGMGIQGNYYGLKNHHISIFDIEINGKPIEFREFLRLLDKYCFTTVPILAFGVTLREWLEGRSLKEASNGFSVLGKDKLREGIVIKPMIEQHNDRIGRLFLKQRSPEYLSKSDY